MGFLISKVSLNVTMNYSFKGRTMKKLKVENPLVDFHNEQRERRKRLLKGVSIFKRKQVLRSLKRYAREEDS